METALVYMTCANEQEAQTIGKTLVEERLAACVNIVSGMRSYYWWEGAVQEGDEVVLLAKTRSGLVDMLTARVKTLHSYTVPCVVAMPITGGNPDFITWITQETQSPA